MAKLTLFKVGAICRRKIHTKPGGGKRGVVGRQMSPQSRRRAAFAFGNANIDWKWMATLTWHIARPDGGGVCAKVRRSMTEWLRRREILHGWILEFCKSGSPHFHFFFSDLPPFKTRTVTRHGKPVEVCADDGFAKDFVDHWLKVSGVEDNKFQRGGIIERLRSPDAAGRYVAKECSKRAQKEAPEGFDWRGRWWGLPHEWSPVPEGEIEIPDVGAPQYSLCWDKNNLPPPAPNMVLDINRPSRCYGKASHPGNDISGGG